MNLYPIQVKTSKDRGRIFNFLKHENIGVNVHYIPIHTQPFYQKMGFKKGDFPNSEKYYSREISIPLHHNLTLMEQDKIVENICQII